MSAPNELYKTTLFTDANLQYYARLEGNFNDSSPNAYNMTAHNTPTFGPGQFGSGAVLGSASSQYAELVASSATAIANMNSSQTWFCWINPSTNGAAQEPISCYDGASGLRRLQLNSGSNGKVEFQLLGLTTNSAVSGSAGTPALNSWTFLAGVYNSASSYLAVLVNGTVFGSVTASGTVANTVGTGTFDIGRLGGGAATEYFNGTVDEMAVFNRALSNTEIANYYQGLTPLRAANVGMYYTQF